MAAASGGGTGCSASLRQCWPHRRLAAGGWRLTAAWPPQPLALGLAALGRAGCVCSDCVDGGCAKQLRIWHAQLSALVLPTTATRTPQLWQQITWTRPCPEIGASPGRPNLNSNMAAVVATARGIVHPNSPTPLSPPPPPPGAAAASSQAAVPVRKRPGGVAGRGGEAGGLSGHSAQPSAERLRRGVAVLSIPAPGGSEGCASLVCCCSLHPAEPAIDQGSERLHPPVRPASPVLHLIGP